MPAEKIHSARHPNAPVSPHLRLSWGADMGYVQVASLFEAKHGADLVLTMVNEWLKAAELNAIPGLAQLDRLIKDRAGAETTAGQLGIGFEGFHASLDDRRDINRLIAVARRSRDQAMGKDE